MYTSQVYKRINSDMKDQQVKDSKSQRSAVKI